MRVMIDSNILDHLDVDREALDELTNRHDILLLVTPAQEREVAAIPDPAKRERLLGIIAQSCKRLALPGLFPSLTHPAMEPSVEQADTADDSIVAVAVAAGCDLLVSEDIDVLNKALAAGVRAKDWKLFLGRVVWAPRRKLK
jgi:predicted nucleic acid-binding protein